MQSMQCLSCQVCLNHLIVMHDWGIPKMVVSQNQWFIFIYKGKPYKTHDLGVPPILGSPSI